MIELVLAFAVVLSLAAMFVLVWPILQDYHNKEGLWTPPKTFDITFETTEASAEYEAIADACKSAVDMGENNWKDHLPPSYNIHDRPAMCQPRFQTHAGHVNEIAKFTVEYEGVEDVVVFHGYVKEMEYSNADMVPQIDLHVRVIGDSIDVE